MTNVLSNEVMQIAVNATAHYSFSISMSFLSSPSAFGGGTSAVSPVGLSPSFFPSSDIGSFFAGSSFFGGGALKIDSVSDFSRFK